MSFSYVRVQDMYLSAFCTLLIIIIAAALSLIVSGTMRTLRQIVSRNREGLRVLRIWDSAKAGFRHQTLKTTDLASQQQV